MKKVAVKKLDMSAVISNLAVVSAVIVVSLPLLLGDELPVVASRIANEGVTMIEDLANSLFALFI